MVTNILTIDDLAVAVQGAKSLYTRDRLCQELVERLGGLITNVVKGFSSSFTTSMDIEDYRLEAMEAIWRATYDYDIASGPFIPFAKSYIFTALYTYQKKNTLIVTSNSSFDNVKKYRDLKKAYEKENRILTDEEAIRLLGVTLKSFSSIKKADTATSAWISFDAPLKDDDKKTIGDLQGSDVESEKVMENLLLGDVYKELGNLDDFQKTIVKDFYGLDGQEPKTLTVIGKELGVTEPTVIKYRKLAEATIAERLAG